MAPPPQVCMGSLGFRTWELGWASSPGSRPVWTWAPAGDWCAVGLCKHAQAQRTLPAGTRTHSMVGSPRHMWTPSLRPRCHVCLLCPLSLSAGPSSVRAQVGLARPSGLTQGLQLVTRMSRRQAGFLGHSLLGAGPRVVTAFSGLDAGWSQPARGWTLGDAAAQGLGLGCHRKASRGPRAGNAPHSAPCTCWA